MTNYQVRALVEVSPVRVCDLIVGALEGGSAYWMTDFLPSYPFPMPKNNGIVWYANNNLWVPGAETEARVRHCDMEKGDPSLPFNVERINFALHAMAANYTWHWSNFVQENDDAETADVFMQLAVLGEVVYG